MNYYICRRCSKIADTFFNFGWLSCKAQFRPHPYAYFAFKGSEQASTLAIIRRKDEMYSHSDENVLTIFPIPAKFATTFTTGSTTGFTMASKTQAIV